MAKAAVKKKEAEKSKLPVYAQSGPTLLAQQPAIPEKESSSEDEPWWGSLRGRLESRLTSLYNWRESWWSQNWSNLAEFILPRRSTFLTQNSGGSPSPNNMNRGREINNSIIDPTATYAARVCSGGLVSGLASPSRPWMKVGPAVDRTEVDAAGRAWLDETEARMYSVIAASNFYDSFAQECEDVLVFGTAPQIIYDDDQSIFRCYNPCIGEYYLATGASGRHNGLSRKFLFTITQIVDFFGLENCPGDIQKLWEEKGSGLDTERIIAHAIEPNFAIADKGGRESVGIVPGGYTWREVYWVWGSGSARPLSMEGFHDCPFTVSTWSQQGNDAYGRSPGMDVLPDVMQLQVMTRRLNEAIEKQVRPPLIADEKLRNQPSSILPGHVTYVPGLVAGGGMRPIYDVMPQVQEMSVVIQQLEARIKTGLFNDLFLAISNLQGDQRSATEISARIAEAMQVVGPVIEAMLGVLKQKLKRIYGIMLRKGLIDPPPQSLQGVPLDITFTSYLAVAQKAAATGSMERIVALLGNLAAEFPDAKDLLDVDAYVRIMNDMLGNQQRILHSPEQVQQIRQIQQQAAATTQKMNMMQHAAQTAQTGAQAAQVLSQTPVGPGQSALNQMLGTGGAGQ